MKNAKKMLALLLALMMCVGVLSGCGSQAAPAASNEPVKEAAPAEAAPAEAAEEPAETGASADTPLVVGYSPFNSKFSPFFSETAYDQDAMTITQMSLLPYDRTGAMILNGIEGETVNYNGTDYTYYGPADCVITENEDGTVFYDFKLRDDLVFSDGEPLTIDDVIFSMYVLSDPTYDGSSSFFALPILGMEAYRSGVDTLLNLIFNAGRENTDFTYFDEATQTEFWTKYDAATTALAQEIVDYCVAAGYNEEGDITGAAGNWGFSIPENGTIEDFAAALEEAYGADVAGMIGTENAGSTVDDLFPDLGNYSAAGIQTGESAPSIEGIQKVDDYNLRVVLTEVNATAIYQFGLTIAPLHYYGDASLYDYDNNSFGFPKGDLSSVRAKTTQPMGAGPYKFIKFENGVINYEANDLYFKGAPKTKYVNFQQCTTDDDKLNGVVTGTIDITDPSYSSDTVEAIKAANGNDDVNGDVIATNTVDNLGYGYIGMNSIALCVNDEPASDASKNLRRAFATIFCIYRDVAISSYYGERASVINYPISNTSWAAPRPADDGYQLAFSVDVDGNPIYTSAMTDEEKYAAALSAALGYFEAAGYTVEDGKLTAAPEGAALEYTFWIPADGSGDHPAFMIVNEAKNALATIGMNLVINDLTDSSLLWDALDAKEVPMWAAAWGASLDPDMTQIYFADVANGPMDDEPGKNPLGGPGQGGSNYMYCIADSDLDQLIKDALASSDQAYRKAVYKAALDAVIDWAVEVPTYQRQNAIIFSSERVNMDTVTPDITTFYAWLNEIENVALN